MRKTIVLLGVISLLMVACNEEKKVEAKKTPKPTPATKPAAPKGTPVVVFQTTAGDFEIQMEPKKAPKTVENFLTYVKQGHFDGTVFHRIVNVEGPRGSFKVVQGGGFTLDGKQKPTNKPIVNEADNGLKNDRGTISMARTRHPHSGTSQFFINTIHNAGLDYRSKTVAGYGYCVFGKIIKGMDVVDKIQTAPTKPNPNMPGERSVPANPVVVKKAYIK